MRHADEHARYDRLVAMLAAGELSEDDRRELDRHIEGCTVCREEVAVHEAMKTLLAARPTIEVTDEMLQEARMELRVRLRVERSADGGRMAAQWFTGWLGRPALRAVALGALMLAIGLGGGYLLFSSSRSGVTLPLQTAMLVPGASTGGSQITAVHFVDADASDGEVEIAFQAVKPMRLKGSPDDPAIQKLLAYALVTEPNAGIRLRTVNELTENRKTETDPEIYSALLKVVKYDTNPGVRKQALKAISRLPMDEEIKKALLYVLANDPNEGLRIDAIDALLPAESDGRPDDKDVLQVLKNRMQNENNNYIRLRTRAALQEVQQ